MKVTLCLLATALLISACNTFEGMGEDMQTGGKKIERAADKNKGPDSRAVEQDNNSY